MKTRVFLKMRKTFCDANHVLTQCMENHIKHWRYTEEGRWVYENARDLKIETCYRADLDVTDCYLVGKLSRELAVEHAMRWG